MSSCRKVKNLATLYSCPVKFSHTQHTRLWRMYQIRRFVAFNHSCAETSFVCGNVTIDAASNTIASPTQLLAAAKHEAGLAGTLRRRQTTHQEYMLITGTLLLAWAVLSTAFGWRCLGRGFHRIPACRPRCGAAGRTTSGATSNPHLKLSHTSKCSREELDSNKVPVFQQAFQLLSSMLAMMMAAFGFAEHSGSADLELYLVLLRVALLVSVRYAGLSRLS